MKRILALFLALALWFTYVAAHAGSMTLLGVGRIAAGSPPPSGKILLVDGVSFLLQTDGVSKICRAGGC